MKFTFLFIMFFNISLAFCHDHLIPYCPDKLWDLCYTNRLESSDKKNYHHLSFVEDELKLENNHKVPTENYYQYQIWFEIDKNNNVLRHKHNNRDTNPEYIFDSILYLIDADSIWINSYLVRRGTDMDPVVTSYSNYVKFKKNNKYGILIDSTVIESSFDTIYGEFHVANQNPALIVGKWNETNQLKLGIINSEGRLILPIEYDSISIPHYHKHGTMAIIGESLLILAKDRKFGLINTKCEMVLAAEYDIIEEGKWTNGFSTNNNGKYGFYYDSAINCLPIFNYKVKHWAKFNGNLLFELMDKNGITVGYANKQGLIYLKN